MHLSLCRILFLIFNTFNFLGNYLSPWNKTNTDEILLTYNLLMWGLIVLKSIEHSWFMIFICVGVMYSGEYDACDGKLLWVYIHTGQAWKICLTTVGIEPTTFGIPAQCSANWATRSCRFEYVIFRNRITFSNRQDRVAQLAEHWASIPKVVGSIPTVVRHIFQAYLVWIYTQSNITSISLDSRLDFNLENLE